MKQNEADKLSFNLANKFGLPVRASLETGPSGQFIILTPLELHPNEGFQIKIKVGWRSLYIDLLLGNFAADLLKQMANSIFEKKLLFAKVAQYILDERGTLTLKINGDAANPVEPSNWPSDWKSLSFSLQKTPLEINTENHRLTEQIINLWVERFYACIIALCPLEELQDEEDVIGVPEGAVTMVLMSRYERSRYNRSICINFHGCRCKVCGMNFEEVYGEIGEGFIHVHHIVPVSQLGANYMINPLTDLVPVCPNCHYMLHKKDPPLKVEELKDLVELKKI